MGSRDSAKLEAARALERKGAVDAAVHAFLDAGDVDEAARVLISAGRFLDAGRGLLRSLGVAIAEVGKLTGPLRKRAGRHFPRRP